MVAPLLLPAALLLGSFYVLTQENPPGSKPKNPQRQDPRVYTDATESGTVFKPQVRGALMNLLSRYGIEAEDVQGGKGRLYRLVQIQPGAISAAQAVVTFESKGYCAVVSMGALVGNPECYLLIVKKDDVPTVTGPTSTLALLPRTQTMPAQTGAVGKAVSVTDGLSPDMKAPVEKALSDENADPADLRAIGESFPAQGYEAIKEAFEKRAKELELKARLSNIQKLEPLKDARPERKANGSTKTKVVASEVVTDGKDTTADA